jgi:hypothetical protein
MRFKKNDSANLRGFKIDKRLKKIENNRPQKTKEAQNVDIT